MKNKGINGYSLQGPSGFKGKNGKNIFFCAYGINSHNSEESQHGEYEDTVNDFISQKRALSNNSNYIETVNYNDGDIILDSNGDLYLIKNGKIVSEPIGSIYSDDTIETDGQNSSQITAEWDISEAGLLKNKYNYKATQDGYKSPFYIHKDSFFSKIPFHKISVSLNCGSSITNIKYMKVSVVIDKSIEHISVYDDEITLTEGTIEKEILLDKRYFTSSPNIGNVSGGIPENDDYQISNLQHDAKPENRIEVYIDFVTETERGDITYSVKAEKKTNE